LIISSEPGEKILGLGELERGIGARYFLFNHAPIPNPQSHFPVVIIKKLWLAPEPDCSSKEGKNEQYTPNLNK